MTREQIDIEATVRLTVTVIDGTPRQVRDGLEEALGRDLRRLSAHDFDATVERVDVLDQRLD